MITTVMSSENERSEGTDPPHTCLGGWRGEGQCAGEMEEIGGIHVRPQPLTDSRSCCCSTQPLKNSETSLLMKGPRCSPTCHETHHVAVKEGSAGNRLEPLLAGNIVPLSRRKNCVRAAKRMNILLPSLCGQVYFIHAISHFSGG